MNKQATNGTTLYAESFETPFADTAFMKLQETKPVAYSSDRFSFEKSPFSFSFETNAQTGIDPRIAGEYVDLLSELHDPTFAETLYEVAAEVEDSFSSRFSAETGGGSLYIPSRLNVENYFSDFMREADKMFDKVSEHYSRNDMATHSDAEIELFFNEVAQEHTGFSPAQDQLFGSIVNKVKSVVKKGIDLAKKGVKAVSKFLPINLLLNRLKKFVRPLLDKVLKFAIGKLPKSLQPHAQTLAKKFLNLETSSYAQGDNEIPTTADLETIQTELDNNISQLVMADDEVTADELVQDYLQSDELVEGETDNGATTVSLQEARQQFIYELKNLPEGESPEPAIEGFLPVALMAIKPIAKMAIGMAGRQRVINFLAGLLTKLIGGYVPKDIADPLAKKIVDVGMTTIGFEVNESQRSDLAYEAISNTIEDTLVNLELDPVNMNNEEEIAEQLFVAFETAAANNFPAEYIREEVKKTKAAGMWIAKPRGAKASYKKYTEVFNVEIDPSTAQSVTVFRDLPLANFLKDKLGLDVSQPIAAKVHLYQAIPGTRLSQIARNERVAGLGKQPGAFVQLHPLTKQAATLLLKDPGLGKDLPKTYTSKRYKTAVGQRFYYLEINGARLRVPNVQRRDHRVTGTETQNNTPGHSGDIQAVLNFVKSEIRLNYYFSEEEARSVVEKLNSNDIPGIAGSLRTSLKSVLNNILRSNVASKVKLVHEMVPELYLEHYPEQQQLSWSDVKNAAKGVVMNAGKEILTKVVEKVSEVLSNSAYKEVLNYFKARATEFKEAQAQPQDGVTVKIIWNNVQGMAAIGSVIKAIRGNFSFDGLKNLSVPSLPTPEIQITASKQFD